VMDKKKENLYQVACLRLYELSHKNAIAENVGNHPNAFINSSLQYNKELEKKNKKSVTPQAVNGGPPVIQNNKESAVKNTNDTEMKE
jgi:hypothetical protein